MYTWNIYKYIKCSRKRVLDTNMTGQGVWQSLASTECQAKTFTLDSGQGGTTNS